MWPWQLRLSKDLCVFPPGPFTPQTGWFPFGLLEKPRFWCPFLTPTTVVASLTHANGSQPWLLQPRVSEDFLFPLKHHPTRWPPKKVITTRKTGDLGNRRWEPQRVLEEGPDLECRPLVGGAAQRSGRLLADSEIGAPGKVGILWRPLEAQMKQAPSMFNQTDPKVRCGRT